MFEELIKLDVPSSCFGLTAFESVTVSPVSEARRFLDTSSDFFVSVVGD
jgi:hypothetical protein